ncbi:hypothetical protein H4219_000454 [Mycoemilia scoparia]|uniref:ER-derived vesicles protein ERV14 n=1 Tax=Mycoemilia scoparia TaxID=417184 RepID=A0A9W8ABW0_9FUNG|nr:hypothetical protein H4219_000454 [Mycoemilia scoparia]
MLTDLECDYINPIDLANNLNNYVVPEMAVHAVIFAVFLLSFEWMTVLINLPLFAWNASKFTKGSYRYDATEVFRTLDKHKRENFIKVGFYLLSFFYYLYCMIMALIADSSPEPVATGAHY